VETGLMFRLSRALLRVFARVVPARQREDWLQEWEAELDARRTRLAARDALTRRQEVDMFRRVLGSLRDAAWLRRQFTRDADLIHDLRYGVRLSRRNPGFALLTVTVLALGIGATTAIFSVVDALLIRQLPYRDPERVVLLFETSTRNRAAVDAVAPANVIDWQQRAQSFDVMAAAEPYGFTYTGDAEPLSLPGARVTQGFFGAFGIQPLYGRTFSPDEHTAGRNQVVVLSYGVWSQRFGADPGIVGRAIRLNGQPQTVVGVMPSTFAPRLLVTFNERGVWSPKVWTDADRQLRGAKFCNVVARLRPGASIQQAQSELDSIASTLAKEYPRTNADQTVQIVSLREHLAGDLRASIGLLMGAVALLLVIAMANTANLLIARGTARAGEIAARIALGADWVRLMRQLLAETLLLAGLGCAVGLLVAHGGARLIVSLAPADIPGLAAIGVNTRVLVFSSLLTCVVALLIGLVPAWKATSIGSRFSVDAGYADNRMAPRQRARAAFVVVELALALTLLAGGGLLLRSFSSLLQTSPGFTPQGVAALQIFVRGALRPPERAALIRQIVDGMRSVPQVREVGAAAVIPFLDTTGGSSIPIVIEGRAAPAPGDEPSAFVNVATPGYFSVLRVPLLEGRLLDDRDDADRAPVAVVSKSFVERHWRETSPIGQKISFRLRGVATTAEIVGVVGDLRHDALDRPASPEVFLPHAQASVGDMTFVARTIGDPAVSLAALRAQLHEVAPHQAIYRTATLQDLVANSLNDRRFMLTLLLAFAVVAVGLAATGVYGVMTLVSAQRRREFGVRLALGAGRGEILRMVLREGSAIILVGIATGLVGALVMGQLLRGFLFGIGPYDPWTVAGVCAVLAIVAAIACLLPAVRATRVNPLVALRAE
jgi:putative ABC transport system permease protein